MERLRAEIRDRESERADLRDRVQKAEAQVARVEELAYTPRPAGRQQDTALLGFVDDLRAALGARHE